MARCPDSGTRDTSDYIPAETGDNRAKAKGKQTDTGNTMDGTLLSLLEELRAGSLEKFLDKVTYGLLIVDRDGFIIYVTDSFMEHHRVGPEVVGRHVTEVIKTTRLHIVAKTGIEERDDYQLSMGKSVLASRIPLFADNGNLVGVIGIIRFTCFDHVEKLKKKVDELKRRLSKMESIRKLHAATDYGFADIVAACPRMRRCKATAMRAAQSDATVLLLGETGVGKEVFAHSIHRASPRADWPFVRINCSAIQESLFESELFGYEKGAFTGADAKGKRGKFELANKGTIFLDEIGDMPVSLQTKLLRVLQDKEISPLGGEGLRKVNVRVIAATNQDLQRKISEGTFRKDLFYRLNVLSITIPPLRERIEEIPGLAERLWDKLCAKHGIYHRQLGGACLRFLQTLPWPGNVRELLNCLENCLILAENEIITPADLQNALRDQQCRDPLTRPDCPPGGQRKSLAEYAEEFEKRLLRTILRQNNNSRTRAAQCLGISRSMLYRKLHKHGLLEQSDGPEPTE